VDVLTDRVDALTVEVSHLRVEMRVEFAVARSEMAAQETRCAER
jgi:hypothetical protein